MTDVQQVQDDLRYVRDAVDRRSPGLEGHVYPYYFSALYVLVGFILLDVNYIYANWWFTIAFVAAWTARVVFWRRLKGRSGEIDRVRNRQTALHWGVGVVVSVLAGLALACVIPALRGPVDGQIQVVLIGMVYLMWGVHRDRSFLVLGPLMIAGGVLVALIPHYPWTCLGTVIAVGLVAAGYLIQRDTARRAALA
jgi:hypothetical protein